MGDLIKLGNTQDPLYFLMLDSGDHVTGKTGLVPTVKIKKRGVASGSPAGAVSEVDSVNFPGLYQIAANATDANTLGPLWLRATAAGADPCDISFQVVAFDPYVANLNANIAQVTGDSIGADRLYQLCGMYDQETGVLRANIAGHVMGKIIGLDFAPLPHTPLAYWRFDGNNHDWSGNFFDLNSTPGATYPIGKYGQGVANDTGMSNGGPIGNLNVDDSWTISLWVLGRTGVPVGDVIWADDQGTFSGYGFGPGENHAYVQGPGGGVGSQREITGSQLTANIWHHVVVVNDSGAGALFLYNDGAQIGSSFGGSLSGALSGVLNVSAGVNGTIIDELAIFPVALTSAEVFAFYNRGVRAFSAIGTQADSSSIPVTLTAGERASIATAWGARVLGNGRTADLYLQGFTNRIDFAADGLSYTLYATNDLTPLKTGVAVRLATTVGGLRSIDPA